VQSSDGLADIYDISYISVDVRRRISVRTVLGYNISGGKIHFSARLFDILGISGVMTRAIGGSTELSSELYRAIYKTIYRTSKNHRVNV